MTSTSALARAVRAGAAVLRNSKRFLFAVSIATAPLLANSASCERWYAANQTQEFYSSADAACRGYFDKHGWNPPGFSYDHFELTSGGRGAACFFRYGSNPSPGTNLYNVAIAAVEQCIAAAPEPFDIADRSHQGNQCMADGLRVGNPILPATAEKYQHEIDYADAGPGGLSFARTYRSNRGLDAARAAGPLGKTWTHNHGTSLAVSTSTTSPPSTTTATATATITDPEGYARVFTQANASSPWIAVQSPDTLTFTAGQAAPWTYRRAADDSTSRFDAAGKLQSMTQRNGWTTSYTYNAAGQLTSITGPFARTLTLGYSATGQLLSLTTPDGRIVAYAYDSAGRLSRVTAPDASSRVPSGASSPSARAWPMASCSRSAMPTPRPASDRA